MSIEISIWDNDTERIRTIEGNLARAMRSLNLKGVVKIISEPPLISRENLLNRVPVLEIQDKYWSLKPQAVITEDQCRDLLTLVFCSTQPS
ncbi:MAG: hypothetical protein J6I40_08570 [Mailhella sp.]|nr:hypothetical protein [Mailhella sp.]